MDQRINLMIVGAQKAGTTSLHKYLCEHPEIEGHFTIEFSYFIVDEEFEKGFDHAVDTFYKLENPNPKVLLAKSALFSRDEKAICRLHEHNPDAKLIFLIREPVARAYSSFTFEKMNGGMHKRDFSEITEAIERYKSKKEEGSMYRILVNLGLYANHLEDIYKYFPKKQVKIILFEELKKDPEKVCHEVFNFINVDADFLPNIHKTHNKTKVVRSEGIAQLLLNLRTKNPGLKNMVKRILPYSTFDKLRTTILDFNKKEGKKDPMTEDTRADLKKFFKPHNERLARMIDKDISHWD